MMQAASPVSDICEHTTASMSVPITQPISNAAEKPARLPVSLVGSFVADVQHLIGSVTHSSIRPL